MHREIRIKAALRMGAAVGLVAWALGVQAQSTPAAEGAPATAVSGASISLKQAFEGAWARQPEAQALSARRDAARAAQQVAQAWTPEPMALEASGRSDRLNRNQGNREIEVGIAVPLWLPGERGRSRALAEAEGRAVESRASAAQLRVAAAVREAWWQWQLAGIDAEVARGQVGSARSIAADVARRQQAGDLARSDRNQADGALATAESALARAEAALAMARHQLQAATGLSIPAAWPASGASPVAGSSAAEAEPPTNAEVPLVHAALTELQDQAALAQGAAALAAAQSRAHPEVTLAVTRERGAAAEPSLQTLTLGIRIPFGGGPRHNARVASATAERAEAEARLALEHQRLLAERASAAARLAATRSQLAAAERRAQLAAETRGFFDKSFRLGESDLPTRLRIEAEAAEAERAAARARIEVAAAISAQRQALGLLPD